MDIGKFTPFLTIILPIITLIIGFFLNRYGINITQKKENISKINKSIFDGVNLLLNINSIQKSQNELLYQIEKFQIESKNSLEYLKENGEKKWILGNNINPLLTLMIPITTMDSKNNYNHELFMANIKEYLMSINDLKTILPIKSSRYSQYINEIIRNISAISDMKEFGFEVIEKLQKSLKIQNKTKDLENNLNKVQNLKNHINFIDNQNLEIIFNNVYKQVLYLAFSINIANYIKVVLFTPSFNKNERQITNG